ncbi:MAG TPA: hypothetical protein DCX06_12305 [Opitutae bacterium]|nr:hypothetical protein [Opitutae bacterium]
MKKIVLIFGFIILFSALGLRGYFALVPPPEPTLHVELKDVVPSSMEGWLINDMDIANSPDMAERVSDRLNFDDFLIRIFRKDDTFVRLYIAYWKPGTASYRWAGAHTPDTCWVQAGWSCVEREYSIPFEVAGVAFEPAEYGIYKIKDHEEKVYFWHLVGGQAFGYKQQGGHNIFGALVDIQHYGLNLRQEQFFIRLSSNKDLEELKKLNGFDTIVKSLEAIGLNNSSAATAN